MQEHFAPTFILVHFPTGSEKTSARRFAFLWLCADDRSGGFRG